jgi:hypothetical protein
VSSIFSGRSQSFITNWTLHASSLLRRSWQFVLSCEREEHDEARKRYNHAISYLARNSSSFLFLIFSSRLESGFWTVDWVLNETPRVSARMTADGFCSCSGFNCLWGEFAPPGWDLIGGWEHRVPGLHASRVLSTDVWIQVEAQQRVQKVRGKLSGGGKEDSRMGAGEACTDLLLVPQKRNEWHRPYTGRIFVGQMKHLLLFP